MKKKIYSIFCIEINFFSVVPLSGIPPRKRKTISLNTLSNYEGFDGTLPTEINISFRDFNAKTGDGLLH